MSRVRVGKVVSGSVDLNQVWAAIERPLRGSLSGRRLEGWEPSTWAAVDTDRTPYLLIETASGTADPGFPATRGLDVVVDRLRIGDGRPSTYVALSCVKREYRDTFAALCSSLLRRLRAEDPVQSVDDTLRTWRGFFRERGLPLSHEQRLGLFAELWFLEHWLGVRRGVDWWSGPFGARHDFQGEAVSVEAKATASTKGPVSHRIASLEQLDDPEQGDLFLYSLQVNLDELAANSLPASVARISAFLDNDAARLERFNSGLCEAGYNPGDAPEYRETWRIVGEGLFEVHGDFPRLTGRDRARWSAAITDVTYSVALDACTEWKIADRSSQSPFQEA